MHDAIVVVCHASRVDLSVVHLVEVVLLPRLKWLVIVS